MLNAQQRATLLLWQRVNTSLTAFYKLIAAFNSAQGALQQPVDAWKTLGIHAKHIDRHSQAQAATDNVFISEIEQNISAGQYQLVFSADTSYPDQLNQLFDPPPVLFYRGNIERLKQAQIAVVGSRKPTIAAQKFTFDMAQYLAQVGYIITSGLAQGVDAQAHLGALSQSTAQAGRTVGVMGTGIDVCYPKQHKALFDRVVTEGGCLITELLPGTPPNKHTFPRRNRIVAGLSLGTIVTEAAVQSGSLITARLTSEQGKQVFAIPSSIDNPNAEGCHHLIREGATLIYHPDQVVEDISAQIASSALLPSTNQPFAHADTDSSGQKTLSTSNVAADKSFSPQQSMKSAKPNRADTIFPQIQPQQPPKIPKHSVDIPAHLQTLWVHIDWDGQDLDALVMKTQLPAPELLSQLMELELLGLIGQLGGRYKRL